MPAGEFSIARRARGGAKSGGGPEVPLVRAPSIWGIWSITPGDLKKEGSVRASLCVQGNARALFVQVEFPLGSSRRLSYPGLGVPLCTMVLIVLFSRPETNQ